jgi:hypothetical protein
MFGASASNRSTTFSSLAANFSSLTDSVMRVPSLPAFPQAGRANANQRSGD